MKIDTRTLTTRDGIDLALDIGGTGSGGTIVLLHGGGQTRHSWHGAMGALIEQGFRVICFDARGHGDSQWAPDGDYRVERLADDLDDVLSLGTGPVALVGASMGGMTAFYAVGRSAEPIATALVMVDIALRPAPSGVRKIIEFMGGYPEGFANLEEAADAVARNNPSRPRPASSSGLRRNLRERDGRLFWHWDPKLIAQTQLPEPPDFAEQLLSVADRVTIPTLLIRGGKSDIVDEHSVAEMVALVPQTEVFEVPGAGHMVAGDRNDAFNQGVVNFLDRHMPAKS